MIREGTAQRWMLSILLALLIWGTVEAERPGELTLQVPVLLQRVPAGVTALGAPPAVQVTLTGPRIVLARARMSDLSCRLDLAGSGPGAVAFPSLEGALALDRELKVARVYPGLITVTLVGDRHH